MQFYNYLVLHYFVKLHAKFYNKMFIEKMKSPFPKRHHSILDAMQFNYLNTKIATKFNDNTWNLNIYNYNLFKAKQLKKLMLIVIHHFILHEPGFCLWCGHFPHFDSVLESVKA